MQHFNLFRFRLLFVILFLTLLVSVLNVSATSISNSQQNTLSIEVNQANPSYIPSPVPNSFPEKIERERAQEAIEYTLNKRLHAWGIEENLVELIDFNIQESWAYGKVRWENNDVYMSSEFYVLAQRFKNGNWQAIMPSKDNLYLEWVNQLPNTLIEENDKDYLLDQLANLNTQDTSFLASIDTTELNGPLPTSSSISSYQSLISNDRFLYSSDLLSFDIQAFLDSQPGSLKNYNEVLDERAWTAAEIIEYNGFLHGINPQVIILTLEAIDNVLSNPSFELSQISNADVLNLEADYTFFEYVNSVTSNLLLAYDEHRYGEATNLIEFASGEMSNILPDSNSGTYAIQTTLALFLHKDEWEQWTQANTYNYSERFRILYGYPLNELDSHSTEDIESVASINALPAGYQLPFPVGDTWYYTGGPHSYNSSGSRPWSSVDLAQPEILPCPGSATPTHRWIVASKGGNVVYSGQALVVIDHGDGYRTYYSHVASADRRGLGGINQGDFVGHPSCEIEPSGSTNGIHVHFAIWQSGVGFINISGSSLSDWQIQETTHYDGTMTRNGVTRTADTSRTNGYNDIYNSGTGGACSAPTLLSPGDGETVDNQTVTLDWNAPNCSGLTGYTLHITTGSGPEDGIIWDTGVGPTDYTWTFPNDGTYYWHVTAWANGQSGPWSSRRLVINTSSTGGGDNWHADYYDGQDRWWDTNNTGSFRCDENLSYTGFLDENWGSGAPCGMDGDEWIADYSTTFNFPSGTYVFYLDHDDGARFWLNGEEKRIVSSSGTNSPVCNGTTGFSLNGNNNLRVLLREDGGDALIRLRWDTNVNTCLPDAPDTPSLQSPINGAILTEGDDITLSWNNAAHANDYYAEYWGGPAGLLNSAWQSGTSWHIGSQWAGYIYSWHVKSRNEAGASGWSENWIFTVRPGTPTNLTGTSPSCNQINLNWQDNSGSEEGYNIYRNGVYIGQVSADTTTYQDTGLSGGTNYSYYVKAYRSSIESAASSTIQVRTQACLTRPDLRPVTLNNYQYPVVPSSVRNTQDVNTLYAGQSTYFDWHFINDGESEASGNFYVELWIDDNRYVRYPFSNYDAGVTGGFNDWSETVVEAGWHTVRLITDPDNMIEEEDETNNEWEGEFYWNPVAGWWGEYFNNETLTGNPVLVRDDPAIDFDWGSDSPGAGVNADHFSARWTDTVEFEADTYLFEVSRDDGARLWVDNSLILDEWEYGVATHLIPYTLTTGNHDIRMEMYEISGWAKAGLSWRRTCGDSAEPDDSSANATFLTYGQSYDATICSAGDIDYYSFEGTSGDSIVVDIDARTIGSELDPYIYLEDSSGNVLTFNDDWDSSLDSWMSYQLPADGTYYIRVREYNHPYDGGPDYFYTIHLSIDDTPPIVEIILPQPGDYLTTDVTPIVATATDAESGVNHLQFFVWHDVAWHFIGYGAQNGNEWTQDWDAATIADQGIALWVYAYDNAGNLSHDDFGDVMLDRTLPTSAVNTLPATLDTLTFLVTWSGDDNLSGIASYDVQYRDGSGGTWTNWQSGTTATSASFTGQNGHTYYFRSRARDNAGNREAFPGGNGDTQTTIDVTSNCKTLTLNVDPAAGGSVSADPSPNCDNGTKYTAGTVVELTATANSDYSFVNWSDGASGTNNVVSITMDADKVVTANFDQMCYTLTLTANPAVGGNVSANPTPNCNNGTQYSSGTVVQLTAAASQGYDFDNWSGAASGTSTTTSVTMNGNKSVTANFSTVQTCYTLNLAASPDSGGSISASPPPNCNNGTKYSSGTIVQLAATGNPGYVFDNWNGGATGTSNPTSVTMDGNKTVTANFSQVTGPHLRIYEDTTGYPEQTVDVPIFFIGNDSDIASMAFSIDFDQSCLSFDDTDGNGDDIPDAITFSTPAAFGKSATFDSSDTDGEIDFIIADVAPPLATMPDGEILSVEFTVTCHPSDYQFIEVNFAANPPVSYGDVDGKSAVGTSENGGVDVFPFAPGDCNGDFAVDAGDISALSLEIFDGDGTDPNNASGGTFAGGPGCDANGDGAIDAGDITCTVLDIFEGPGACSGNVSNATMLPDLTSQNISSGGPSLTVPAQTQVSSGDMVTIPVIFEADGHDISSLVFSLDFDEAWLSFDATDSNSDGIPDAVVFNVPGNFDASVTFNAGDTDGELDFFLADIFPPLIPLSDDVVAYVTFTIGTPTDSAEATLKFSQEPAASFGNTTGQSVAGVTQDGTVLIQSGYTVYLPVLIKP